MIETTKHSKGYTVTIKTRTGRTFSREFTTRKGAEAYADMMRPWATR